MKIINGSVYRTDCFQTETLYINGETIVSKQDYREDGCTVDAEGKYVIPGLVDIHFHGCDGYDFSDGTKEAIEHLAAYEAKNGITSIVPASMTLSLETLENVYALSKEFVREQERMRKEDPERSEGLSSFEGIHMEGPYVSEKKKGAQNASYLQKPQTEQFRYLNEISGKQIRIVSMAPELEGAETFIRENAEETVISLAHTTADYDTAYRAFELGAEHVTHTFNAMPPFTHRAPGVIGAAYDHKKVMMELICDGIHIHPSVVRALFGMFGSERMVLISDSMMGTGLEDGMYQLGGQAVTKRGSLATLQDGTIAGSVTNLYDCMCNAIKFGIHPADAVRAASENPAKSARLDGRIGNLREGSFADFLIVGKDWKREQIFHRGRRINRPIKEWGVQVGFL